MTAAFDVSEACARNLDRADPLAHYHSRFALPPDSIYLDGNSLGLVCEDAERSLLQRLAEWRNLGVRGWLGAESPWFHFAERVGAAAADLVGARPEEVVLTGTTTVNIHSLVSTFFEPVGRRRKILTEELAFPTDVYALRDQLRLRGGHPDEDLVLVPSSDGRTIEEADIIDRMSDEIALAWLPSVLYRSGQLLDLERLAAEAHRRGIVLGLDCCHSAGALPHRLHDWGVDCAVWCGYKYLNGGPGCSAFLFLHEKHFDRRPGLSGWFGAKKHAQFDMALHLDHAPAAGGWQISSPGIVGSSTLEGALGLLQEVGIERIRDKSLQLTGYLMFLADQLLASPPYRIQVATPREPGRRGGHVALVRTEEAYRLSLALRARGVVPDFRTPNMIRVAPVALYNRFHDVWRFVKIVQEIIDQREYERFDPQRVAVP